jgi:hypothetical protein
MWYQRLAAFAFVCLAQPIIAQAETKVCVEVNYGVLEDPKVATPSAPEAVPTELPEGVVTIPPKAPPESLPKTAPAAKENFPLPPRAYLRRMLEHYVQHEPGFVVDKEPKRPGEKCEQTLVAELYRTSTGGWTVFARYSGNGTEEKVDKVQFGELPKLARRLVTALLHDKRVEETVTRTSVLEADSAAEETTVRGTHMFQLGIGSTFRFPIGGLPSAVPGQPDAAVTDRFRLVNPVDLQLGYRGDFRRWAVDVYTRVGIGVSYTNSRSNTAGGHVDHLADFEIGMNFLWHISPDAVWSFYAGPGARFELTAFDVVEPDDRGDTDNLIGAGLAVVGVFGVEFLRTTNVRPFAQLELTLPAYVVDTENRDGGIDAWMPGISVVLGGLF